MNGDREGFGCEGQHVDTMRQGDRLSAGPMGFGVIAAKSLTCLCSWAADLAECKLVSFPIGIYKVLRNVTEQIHLITLANNELKALTSKFMTTFCQLRGRRACGRGAGTSK